ncbi:SDR family NAD(P)-dependent oxidoreductase [Streptomyces sp. NPDC049881]|uniref:SDR family NAD(P)-dependent oxidoreductase n=1 Tax=Streptomyces sp. NPDC049881 TaxID=3155778 RepID=UPI0034183AD6
MTEPIAVVGLACRYPGAPDAESFWQLLRDGHEALTRYSDAELAQRGVPLSLRRKPSYVPVGGLVEGHDRFDPAPFGIADQEAEILDPQQRVFLECVWHALEDAGHGGGRGAGVVGVFAGAALSSYLATNLADRFDPSGGADPAGNLQLHSANVADYLPLRTAHRFGFTGPAVAVGATCATSLVSVHLAVQSLLGGECDTAVAGGVALRVPQGRGYLHVPDGPFSRDGHTRPYAAGASGAVFTQGAGVVVLRPLADALRDGDQVLAVVLGSAVGNDGADRAGFTAPSADGQARTIAEALAAADVEPADVSYIEGHGTGTPLGDPIEVSALRRVFGPADRPWCGLGSVKGNIGHADSAAGIAGFIKAVLALHHRTIPPSLFASEPNPELGLDGSALHLVAERQPWQPSTGRRIAGVSSFGVGGVNCHTVLGEAPEPAPSVPDGRARLLVVSGATEDACRATADRLADRLGAPGGEEMLDDAAHTLAVGRTGLPVRTAAVVRPGRPAAEALRESALTRTGRPPRVVFAFPGGDAQYAGLARGLYADEPLFRSVVDELAAVFVTSTGDDPRAVMLAGHDDPRARADARAPRTGLPVLFTTAVATAELLTSYGVVPDLVLGHSVGEYAAAVAAGVLTAADAAGLVAERSLRLAELPTGAMLAVELSEDEARSVLTGHPELELAAVNAPRACVLSGPARSVASAAEALTGAGVTARVLKMDAAGHSRLVEPAMAPLRAVAAGLRPKAPVIPLVTTVTGRRATEAELADPGHWPRHLRSTVRFAEALDTALADGPALVLQVGPGAALAALAAARGREAVPAALPTFPSANDAPETGRGSFLEALGQAWCHGVDVDLSALHGQGRRRVSLPGYAFQRRRYWIEGTAGRRGAAPVGPAPVEPDAADPLHLPGWRQLAPADGPGRLRGSTWAVYGRGARADEAAGGLRAAGATVLAPGEDLLGGVDGSDAQAPGLDGVLWLPEGEHDREDATGAAGDAGGADDRAARRVRDHVLECGRMARRLAAGQGTGATVLLQVTAGGERVLGEEATDPAATGARGLPRVLAQEVPSVRWRTLDLPPGEPVRGWLGPVLAEAADLLASLDTSSRNTAAPDGPSPDGSWELALRGGRRWIRQWEPWRPAEPAADVPALPADPVVVVTGGLGNVGLALARGLCAAGPARVVLAGRSGEPGESATDPRAVRHRETLRELRASGARLRTERVDATDAAALADLLGGVVAEHGRIDLVVHAPVVVELTPLSEVDEETVGAMLEPKADGALALRRAIASMPGTDRPRTVLLMSSAAGTVGGFGLSPYVAASRFLDGVATRADGPGTRWVSVDWDRWRFGTAEEREAVSEITMRHALDADDALAALLRVARLAASGSCPPQVAVSPAELNTRSLALAARTARAAGSGGGTLGTPAERLVAEVWSEALGRQVTGGDDDFFALGGHSLLATRVLAVLRDDHGIDVSLRDLLARPSVSALAGLVADRLAGAGRADGGPAAPVPAGLPAREPAAPGEPFPLTRVQHAYWIGRSGGFELGDVGCHFYYEHDARELDLERYEKAWNRLIARHEMLRALVTDEGENLVLDEVPYYRVPVRDCRDMAEAERTRVLDELRDRLSHRVAAPGRWPLLEVHAVLLPGGVVRVALSIDVLVCDSASYMTMDRELRALYEDPDLELPAIGVTFAECVAALETRSGGAAHRRAAEYWRGRLDALPGAPALPVRDAAGPSRFGRRRAELDAARWQRLRARAAELGVTPTAVVLAAYSDVLAAWSGEEHFGVTLTVFDRPPIHPDVDKVVGEFSSLLLLEVDLRGRPTFEDRVRAVQNRLFADLDHREYSGLELLAERSRRSGRQENIPVVFTGMLGLDSIGGAPPHEHDWLGPVVHGVSQTPQVWLDHQAFELRGALVLQWDVNEAVVEARDADARFAAYQRWLAALADDEHRWREAGNGPVTAAPETAAPVPAALPPGAGGAGGAVEGAQDAAETVIPELARIWGELLELDPAAIPAGASFLNLGGDSLLAVRMAAQIRGRLGVGLALPQIRPTLTLRELSRLVGDHAADGVASRGVDIRLRRRIDRESPFDLLPLQQAYFVGQHGGWELSYRSVHAYTDIKLTDMDCEAAADALDQAIRRVVAHQPMLRARLLPDGTQRILDVDDPSVYQPVRTLDLRTASPARAERELAALRDEMTRQGPDPRTGAGYDARLTFLPGGEGRLHVSHSLLTIDGWSGAVFDREMFGYVADPNVVLPPLLVDFGDYVRGVERLRETDEWRADRDWWFERLPSLPPAPAVPTVADPQEVDAPMMGMREFRLSAAEWARLRERSAAHNVTPASALATAYAVALARLTGQHRFLLTSLQFNRLPMHPDVDRMIGPFSSTSLLPVELGAGRTFTDLAVAVQSEISESLAHNLIAGVEVGRELARLRGSRRPVAPVVFQSTIGLDGALGGDLPPRSGPLGNLEVGDYYQQVRTPQIWLECRVFELRGELVVNFAVVEELFGPGVIDGLHDDVAALTRSLLRDAGWDTAVELPPERDDLAGGHGPTPPAAGAPEAGPPRDETERAVARAWAEVLGGDLVDPDGLDRTADFFALGGDSLLAIRLLGALGPGRTVAPRDFLAEPTVAGLAALLRADGSGSTPSAAAGPQAPPVDAVAVPLRDGSGTPLFLLHPSGGDVVCYAELARHLEEDLPLVALSDPELSGHPGPRGIPEMVGQYLDVIRRRQPAGPYLLGGWSMGGTVAHEVARRLRAEGERVDLLVMIDSNSPDRIVALEGLDRPQAEDEMWLRYLRSVAAFLDIGIPGDRSELEGTLREHGLLGRNEKVTATRFGVFKRHLEALAEHTAGPLDETVPVLLLRTGRAAPGNTRIGMGVDDAFDEPDLGWGPYVAGGMTVHTVDAHHYSLLRAPAVADVARHLGAALRRKPADTPTGHGAPGA